YIQISTHCLNLNLHSFPTRRSSDLTHVLDHDIEQNGMAVSDGSVDTVAKQAVGNQGVTRQPRPYQPQGGFAFTFAHCGQHRDTRSEEHTSELQSRENLVCPLLLEKK